MWSWVNGEPQSEREKSSELFRGISCGGRQCVFAGKDGLNLFDLDAMAMTNILPGDRSNITGIAFNPRAGIIASAVGDRKLVLTDTAGKVVATRGIVGPVRAISFDPAGFVLALCSGGDSVALFDIKGEDENITRKLKLIRETINRMKEKAEELARRIM